MYPPLGDYSLSEQQNPPWKCKAKLLSDITGRANSSSAGTLQERVDHSLGDAAIRHEPHQRSAERGWC